MHFEDFLKIIDQVKGVRLINFWHRGEPLMAPEFPLIAGEASKRGIRSQTHTNGILLAKNDTAKRLVEAGLNRIAVSIDGADEETYRSFRKGGSLEAVKAGIRALASARKQSSGIKPRIIAECLVSGQDERQFRRIYDFALSSGCDEVKFKTFRVNELNDPNELDSLPKNEKLWRYKRSGGGLQPRRKRGKCLRLYYSALIAANGDVCPCCFDSGLNHAFGNVFTEPWNEIWKNRRMRDFARFVNSGNRDSIEMCRNCTEGLKRLYLPKRWVLK